ncbi:MAG: phospholipase D-like domain-containing protein [Candidatus Micrarchaeaceae archaeon]
MTTQEDASYSGDGSYRYIDALINSDDAELMIVSPYISDYYTRKLMKKSGSKLIRVVTSKSSLSYKGALLNNYLAKGTKGYVKAAFALLAMVLISIYLQVAYAELLFTVLLIAVSSYAYIKHSKMESNMKVKVAGKKFVHEKLYIGRDKAIIGSANLTFNGMHKNIEHIEVISDIDRVNELKRHFESLWQNGV